MGSPKLALLGLFSILPQWHLWLTYPVQKRSLRCKYDLFVYRFHEARKKSTYVLGNSFGDLLMCQILNVEFWILHNICYDFFNVFFQLLKAEKNKFLLFNNLPNNLPNIYYIIFKIQHSKFNTLANCQMNNQGHQFVNNVLWSLVGSVEFLILNIFCCFLS